MVTLPRLVGIAAPASGSGKTTVATGLMAALRAAGARGLRAQGRTGLHRPRLPRAGHRAARPQPRPVAVRRGPHRAAVRARRRRGGRRGGRGRDGPVRRADRARGSAGSGFGSTAHVARLLGAPVVLVVDAAVEGRSVAALVAGFARFDPRPRWAGSSSTGSARPGTSRCCAPAWLLPGCRCWARSAARRGWPRLPGTWAWSRSPKAPPPPGAWTGWARWSRGRGPARLLTLARGAGRCPRRPGPARRWPWPPPRPRSRAQPRQPRATPATPATPAPRQPRQPDLDSSDLDSPSSPAAPPAPRDPAAPQASPVVAVAGGAAFTFSYAETAELLAAAGRGGPLRPAARRAPARAGPPAWCSAAGSRRCTSPTWPPTSRSARRWPGCARAGPVAPNVRGCCTWPANWTASRCAGCCPQAAMTGRLTLGYREAPAAGDSVLAAGRHRGPRARVPPHGRLPGHGDPAAWQVPPGDRREGLVTGTCTRPTCTCTGRATRGRRAFRRGHPGRRLGRGVVVTHPQSHCAPQAPGRTPHRASRRASGTTHARGRCGVPAPRTSLPLCRCARLRHDHAKCWPACLRHDAPRGRR